MEKSDLWASSGVAQCKTAFLQRAIPEMLNAQNLNSIMLGS